MAMQPPQPPPNGGGAGLAGDAMARLGFMARWHCDRCGLGFDDFDACEAHEAGCDGTGGDAGAGAQDQGQDQGQGPPLPVVIPQDDDEDEDRPAAAAPVPQRAPHQLPSQPPTPAIIPIHNDGDTIAGGSVSAAAGHRHAAAPLAEAPVAQPARAAREAEQDAIDLTIGDSDSNSDGSSDKNGGDGGDNDGDDDVVVVDDGASTNRQAGAPPAAVAPPPKRGVVTVWTCDVCGIAEFASFDAAAAHEEACAAKKEREDAEAAAAASRKAQQQREAAAAASTAAGAAQTRVGSFRQYPSDRQNQQAPLPLAMAALPPPFQPPRLLQQGAQPRPQPQPQQRPQQQQQHPSNSNINPVFHQQDTKYWSCDVCNASFQSYDAACKHERNCEGNPSAPVKSITTFRGVDGRPFSDEASQLTEPVTLDDDQEPQPPPPAPCWTCDHCQVARFDTYDQASAHEAICRAVAKQLGRNHGGTGATTNNVNTAPAPKRSSPLPAAQLVRTLAANPGQQRALPQEASQMARPASDAAINARMKALRDELSSEKGISDGKKSRKRPSSSDVEDEERLDSSPAADTTKRSAKRQRNSRTASDEEDDSNTAQLVCMVDEDLNGHEYYVPPSGGVPLVSTQSASIFAQLSLYYQIAISNLELCHATNGDKGKKNALDLRCHNCKSNPEFNTFITLSNVSRHNWHKAVKQLAKHVEDCPCLASHTLQDIKSSRKNKKEKALAAYCEFLSSLYGMKDSTLGVVWEKAKPITYEYTSKPKDASDKSKNIPPGQLPRHNLMLPPGSAPKKTIIPDFYFFLSSQYHFTFMKRETSPSNKSTGLINAEPDLTLAICCRHCLCSRPLESIRDGCSSSRYLLESHFISCPATGRLAAGYLDDLRKSKATQEKQCSTSIMTCMRNTMAKTYGMVDLEWNGTCSGVGFSRFSKKYNNYGASWEYFRLPLFPQDSVRPVTEGLRLQVK